MIWWTAFWQKEKRTLITALENAVALLSMDISWMQNAFRTDTPTCLSAICANELDIFWQQKWKEQ